jgi:hypothetical protein
MVEAAGVDPASGREPCEASVCLSPSVPSTAHPRTEQMWTRGRPAGFSSPLSRRRGGPAGFSASSERATGRARLGTLPQEPVPFQAEAGLIR